MIDVSSKLSDIERTIMSGLKDFQRATVERIDYLFRHGQRRVLVSDEVGLGKTLISLKVLCELGLIFYENGRYKSVASANKTDLLNSKTFKILTERSGNNA